MTHAHRDYHMTDTPLPTHVAFLHKGRIYFEVLALLHSIARGFCEEAEKMMKFATALALLFVVSVTQAIVR